jgi:hypothetical protein
MKVIERTFKEWNPESKKQTAPLIHDAIDDDCVLIDKDHQVVVAAQIRIKPELESVCSQVSRLIRHDVKWAMDSKVPARLSGIRSVNRVFGTLEPNKLRRRYGCTPAMLDKENPELAHLLGQIALSNFELFKEIDTQRAAEHERIVRDEIHPDWLIAGSPYTSGVINNSAALPYHKDSGNLIGSWSAMLSIRKNMDGGHLHLPEYGVTLGIPDRSVTIFNGQALWHGVTPMIAAKKDAYRFTLVWYAKKKICQCGCSKDEASRAATEASKPS